MSTVSIRSLRRVSAHCLKVKIRHWIKLIRAKPKSSLFTSRLTLIQNANVYRKKVMFPYVIGSRDDAGFHHCNLWVCGLFFNCNLVPVIAMLLQKSVVIVVVLYRVTQYYITTWKTICINFTCLRQYIIHKDKDSTCEHEEIIQHWFYWEFKGDKQRSF